MPQGTEAIVTAKPKSYTGGLYVAPTGTTLPTDASTALDPAFVPTGYLGPDGFTRSSEASDEDEYAWGGVVVNTVRSEFSVTYEFEFRESANPEVLRVVFGEENVIEDTAAGTLTVLNNSNMAPRQSFVFEMVDRGLGHREVVGNGQILASGEQTFSHAASTTIPVTIRAYPDADGNNAYNYKEIGATTP